MILLRGNFSIKFNETPVLISEDKRCKEKNCFQFLVHEKLPKYGSQIVMV